MPYLFFQHLLILPYLACEHFSSMVMSFLLYDKYNLCHDFTKISDGLPALPSL